MIERYTVKLFVWALVLVLPDYACFGQITPPGLGKVNTAAWMAIGVKQAVNPSGKFVSLSYLGVGKTSNPDNYNPLERTAIYIINQEFYNHFKPHWEYSLAGSYRWENRYKNTKPFGRDIPDAKQEIRFYGRYSFLTKGRFLNFSLTYRPEIRLFYNPNFTPYVESIQFRSRIKSKIAFNINQAKNQKFIVSAEQFFSISNQNNWGKFGYRETRFCLYYSIAPPKSNITLDIGYMNNLIGISNKKDVHYLAFDIVFNNFFKKGKQGL